MTHEEAVSRVRRMADGFDRQRLVQELGHARRGNSIFGSLLSIQFAMPRQYAEPAVVEALGPMLCREVQS